MVKLTLIGRVKDGLPLSQNPRYGNEENEVSGFYRQQGELILQEISRGTLTCPRMTLLIDHHCFHYMIGNGLCYLTLCDSGYPRKLAFYYLKDLQKEFEKMDTKFIELFSKPYAFKRFDYVIGNIRKQYIDARTQANLSKLNSDRQQDLDIATDQFSKVIAHKRPSDKRERIPSTAQMESTLWSSKYLEVMAIKWTPITISIIVASVLLWASFNLQE